MNLKKIMEKTIKHIIVLVILVIGALCIAKELGVNVEDIIMNGGKLNNLK